MSMHTITWAIHDAPVSTPTEFAVLVLLAERFDDLQLLPPIKADTWDWLSARTGCSRAELSTAVAGLWQRRLVCFYRLVW